MHGKYFIHSTNIWEENLPAKRSHLCGDRWIGKFTCTACRRLEGGPTESERRITDTFMEEVTYTQAVGPWHSAVC